MTSVSRRALAGDVEAAHDRGRDPVELAHHELRRARDLVGDRDHGRVQLVADAVALAFEVEQRTQAGAADRDVGRPLPPGDGRTSR